MPKSAITKDNRAATNFRLGETGQCESVSIREITSYKDKQASSAKKKRHNQCKEHGRYNEFERSKKPTYNA